MLIQKIFHLRQSVDDAHLLLRNLGAWSGEENGTEVHCARVEESGNCHVEFRSSGGQRISAVVEEVPGDEANCILFRSVSGMVELAGMVELFPIRPNLTEAVLTVEYEPISPLHKAIEAMSCSLERFIDRQLSSIESCIACARSISRNSAAPLAEGGFA